MTHHISMGASCSPIIADMVLSKLEFDFLTQRHNYGLAKRLMLTRRYIDDIICVGSTALSDCHREIYPASLPLNFDRTEGGKIHFLDLMISTETWERSVYDKRRDFCFEVISMPFKTSNQPVQIGPNVFFSQLLRYARICTTKEELLFNVGLLVKIMRDRGFCDEELANTIKRLNKFYPRLIDRVQGCTYKELIKLIH